MRTTLYGHFYNSITSVAAVTVISVVLALLMANAVVRYEYRGGSLTDAFIYIPIVIPEITESLSLLILYGLLAFPQVLEVWSSATRHKFKSEAQNTLQTIL